MNDMEWKRPALIGGLIVALPSLMPLLSLALCLWCLLGGAVAAKLLWNRSTRILTFGDGARVGLMAGLIGGAIYFIVSAPLSAWQMDRLIESIAATPNFPSVWADTLLQVQENFALRVGVALISSLIASLIMVGFTVLGGLIGVAIFEKRKNGNAPPQYPPQYPPQDPPSDKWPSA